MFLNSILFGACVIKFESDFKNATTSLTLFTNTSINLDIKGGEVNYLSVISTNERPNGVIEYNLTKTVTLKGNEAAWITMDVLLGDLSNNDTRPNFVIDVVTTMGTYSVNSLAFMNLSTQLTTLSINTKDLEFPSGSDMQLTRIKLRNIDVGELIVKNFAVRSSECTIDRKFVLLADFASSEYTTLSPKKSYLHNKLTGSYPLTFDNGVMSFKKTLDGSSKATAIFRVNPQCSLQYKGISFTGTIYLCSMEQSSFLSNGNTIWI